MGKFAVDSFVRVRGREWTARVTAVSGGGRNVTIIPVFPNPGETAYTWQAFDLELVSLLEVLAEGSTQ